MKKRFLAYILVVSILCTLLPAQFLFVRASAASAVWDGQTTEEPETDEEGVYQIGNGAQLAWFADNVNKKAEKEEGLVNVDAVLINDIDLGGREWMPISATSYAVYAYSGTFNGQNHTISGLKIDTTVIGYGLFGFVNNATIKNIKVSGTITSTKGVGGIVGKMQAGTIENCSMNGTVISTGTSTTGYAGGIVGTLNAAGVTIKGCHNAAAVSGSYAGGILGYNTKSAMLSHCYNTGKIDGTTRSGGIAGQSSLGSISYCYSIGESKNGICGFSNATVTNCYYLKEKTQDETSTPGGTASGYLTIESKEELLNQLNAGAEQIYEEDVQESNEGYPILSWEVQALFLPIPVTSVLISGDAITGANLFGKTMGDGGEPATNVTYQWSVSDDGENFTEIETETASAFLIPDSFDYVGKYIGLTVKGEKGSEAFAKTPAIKKSQSLIKKEEEAEIAASKEALSLSCFVITNDTPLILPDKAGECSVKWTSSVPAIIADDGVVTLPEDGMQEVTLTAEISYGSSKDKKEFVLQVWPENKDAKAYLEQVLESIKWDYKNLIPVYGQDTNLLVKFQGLLQKKGYNGISVTIEDSEDESLVSKNGKIYYPSIPESENFSNGKQVTVAFRLTVGEESKVWPEGNNNALLIPWDTSSVKQSMETAADMVVSEETLCEENNHLNTVSANLTLPSCVGVGEGKYSFAWITWESSDEEHLSISDENRTASADAIYNPYIGNVRQDGEEHTVTLTATFQNPSTNVTVVRAVEVTILPMKAEELEQTLTRMNQVINCYTADKLMDITTKKQLDIDAVTNDIQLVIPKNVVTPEELSALDYGTYWDYWNYKFTVISSNTDVVEINSFRGYVFRPLGESAQSDQKVNLTVNMQSKTNPNLSVQKEITITVKHLTREEVHAALDLMDQAKFNYAEGLLGNNIDAYSIIDNLTPYKEIVWNEDHSNVDFIYRNADVRHNGIIIDELPEWEVQEDWRLFHSSNKDLVSNETLILNETPKKDTFVKINSVLTDEAFGKYYTKFKNAKEYDVEALEKFKQLYKQPVYTYLMVVGDGNYTNEMISMPEEDKAVSFAPALEAYRQELEQPIYITFTLLGLDGEVIIEEIQEDSFTKGATVFDVFKKVLEDKGISYTAKGSYVSSIGTLAETDYGANSGWMYTVGDVFVNSYMNAHEISDGESVVVKYVRDYTVANDFEEEKPGDDTSSGDAQKPGDDTSSGDAQKPGDSTSSGDAQKPGDSTSSGDAQRPGDNNSTGEGKNPQLVTPAATTQAPAATTESPVKVSGPDAKALALQKTKQKLSSVKSKKAKQVTVTFKKNKNATGYQVQYSTSKKFTKKATKTVLVKKTSCTIKKLKSKKTYYVRVRSVRKVNDKNYYGKYSAVRKIVVK